MSLRDIPFLAGLDPAISEAVAANMVSLAIPGGATLFDEGDAGDGLYTLVSGCVGISMRDPHTGTLKRIARLNPPETVGEMALLSSAPRSATATALRDSHVLYLARPAFERIIAQHPETLLYFSRLLVERLRSVYEGRPLDDRPRTFAVLAVTEGPATTGFGHRLAEALDAVLPGTTGCLADWPAEADEAWFHAFEAAHARTIFVAQQIDCPWCQLCLRHADHVLLLAAAGAPPRPGVAEYVARIRSDWVETDLVVCQDEAARLPRPLHPEIAALSASLTIHVRQGRAPDLVRLARLVSGCARGLVLGGGGARGLAHLGVLEVLEEAGLTIDLIGGTSMGAIIAASVAMGWNLAEIRERTIESFVGRNPLNDYTLPYLALTRGAKVDAGLAERFGNATIENLWLPFFCISSNLTTGSAMIHRAGKVAAALRASIAIPGLLPPVCSPEGVLVDGGMMNNLPADVMARLKRGRVLAVDVGSDLAFQSMPMRSWRGRTLRRWLGAPDAMPAIAPLLLRAATVSSDAQSMMAVSQATVVLKPALAGVDLRAWSSFENIAALGAECTRDALASGRLAAWADPGE
ncbi:patatin-like phospholipase family protein [Methylobacterium komagatae]|uniref:Patatin-like phospholipase family protein n=1 Tax=Methylobacterium komagatae TaxID=374425 RepID=A0ABW2BIA5_9HYPH